MGLGYSKQPVKAVVNDETLTRALGTNYQNTTGRPLLVLVTATCNKKGAAEAANIRALVAETTPPAEIVQFSGFCSEVGSALQKAFFTLCFTVPNQWYYKVDGVADGTSSVVMYTWFEVEL